MYHAARTSSLIERLEVAALIAIGIVSIQYWVSHRRDAA